MIRSAAARLFGALLALALCAPGAAAAEPSFPPLTGRIVDQAGLLPTDVRARLDAMLEAHEKATSNQVVVVTLKSLQGYDIADYGYRLGRHWGIGQASRNNGTLLIVAPAERLVRIEVGYGLEGVLTDAISYNIIQARILPLFRAGNYAGGIEAGVISILSALKGSYEPLKTQNQGKRANQAPDWPGLLLFGVFFIVVLVLRRHLASALFFMPWGMRTGGGGGSFGGGSFGGGGGSFGGGGASGSW